MLHNPSGMRAPVRTYGISVDMRKGKDLADFSKAIIDLMVNAHCMAQESMTTFVINPG
jgi:hypothetical protein